MIKSILIFICLCAPPVLFAQSKALVDSINKVIGPEYVLDVDTAPPYHSGNSFKEADLTGDGINEMVIVAGKADTTEESDSNKIFVLERRNNQLGIMDNSATYEVDGRGPSVQVQGLNLIVTHTFHHGENGLTFQFNRQLKKYILITISGSWVSTNSPEQGLYTSVSKNYDVKKQLLSKSSGIGDYGDEKLKKTTVKQHQKDFLKPYH